MKKAIVTGASSGIGDAVSAMLADMGYEVYGIGRNFENSKNVKEGQHLFHPIICDVTDVTKLTECIKTINADHDIELLVNNAGVGYYGLHEELNPKKIHELTAVNLEAPMIISGLLLRDIKKNHGTIVFISSVTAGEVNPHGCAYGATKAGLTSFAHSLFAETRKYGVRVINMEPDMTQTNLYRNADFECDDLSEASLLPEDVAETLRNALDARDGVVYSDITLVPQLHRIRKKNTGNGGSEQKI